MAQPHTLAGGQGVGKAGWAVPPGMGKVQAMPGLIPSDRSWGAESGGLVLRSAGRAQGAGRTSLLCVAEVVPEI